MLELKTKLLDDQVYVVWFCLTQDSVNDYISDFENDTATRLIDLEDDKFALDEFECVIFPKELKKNNIDYIGPLSFRYLSNLNYSSPLIGVCKFIKGNNNFNVSYPLELSKGLNQLLDEVIDLADNSFKQEMLRQGLYYERASNVVLEYGKIDYELRYISNGQVIEVVKDQHFDLFLDDDIDINKIKGAKIGDFIVIDTSPVIIGILIQNITNRYLYKEDEYDKDLIDPILNKYHLKSFQELRNRYNLEYQKIVARDAYFKDVISQMAKSVGCHISNEVIKFIDEYKPFPFSEEYCYCENSEEKIKVIKKLLVYYYLTDNYEPQEGESYDTLVISDSLLLYHLNGNVTARELAYEINKAIVLDKMIDSVKDINKKYK